MEIEFLVGKGLGIVGKVPSFYTYSHADLDGDENADAHSYTNSYSNPYTNCNSDADRNSPR
jgi:hypothetical protein